MSNRLIPTGPHVTVWVVSVRPDGEYQPLAVIETEPEALQLCKLIGMSAPEQKPRRDAVWMPSSSVYAKAKEIADNPNAGVMLRSADEYDPHYKLTEADHQRFRDVTADIAAGRPTAIGRLFGGSEAVQIVGGVRTPAKSKESK